MTAADAALGLLAALDRYLDTKAEPGVDPALAAAMETLEAELNRSPAGDLRYVAAALAERATNRPLLASSPDDPPDMLDRVDTALDRFPPPDPPAGDTVGWARAVAADIIPDDEMVPDSIDDLVRSIWAGYVALLALTGGHGWPDVDAGSSAVAELIRIFDVELPDLQNPGHS